MSAVPFADDLRAELGRLSPDERRWLLASSADPERLLNALLLKRLRRNHDGEPYFDLGGMRIYFRIADWHAGEEELLQSTLAILRGVCHGEEGLFNEHVFASPGDVVLDLGAHIGLTAMLLSRRVGAEGRVFAFEPLFTDVLTRNVRENELTNVRVVPEAAWHTSARGNLALTDWGIDAGVAGFDFAGPRMPTDLVALDDFVEREGLDRLDLIKMDIEGAEEMAIRGAEQVIRRFRPGWSIDSYHTDHAGEEQHPKLVRRLAGLGYQVEESGGSGYGERRIFAW